MNMFGFALNNLGRRPARTALSLLGIGLAVGSAIALVALSRGIHDTVNESLDERGADLIVTQRSATDFLSGRLPESLEPRIAALPGVASVEGELVSFTTTLEDRHVLVAGWPPETFASQRIPLASGRLPQPGERGVVIVGDAVAESLGLRVDDSVTLFEEPFRVVGITRYGTLMNRGLIVMPLAGLQEASYRAGQVSGYYVRLERGLSPAEIERVRAAILAAGPVLVSQAQDVLSRDRNVAVLNAVSLAISVIALGAGALNVLSTLLMSVQERTREIGMIAAMGWSDGRIIALIMIEGFLLGLAGCALGVTIGVLASRLFSALPAIGQYIAFHPRADNLVLPLAVALGFCLLGAIYPAWRAVRMHPAEALRRG